MLLPFAIFALAFTLTLAELPWPQVYRDTRGLSPGDHVLLSVSSNVSATFAAIDSAHARVMQPLLQQLDSQSVLWDIGAGIGTVSLHAAHRGARVYAFEWDPTLLMDLQASVRANEFGDRVTIVAAFPCARSGSAVMFRRLKRAGTFAGMWHTTPLHFTFRSHCPLPLLPGIFRELDSTFSRQTEVQLLHLQRAVAEGLPGAHQMQARQKAPDPLEHVQVFEFGPASAAPRAHAEGKAAVLV